MTIHIDGIVYSLQRQGGISVYFNELLRHIASRHVPAQVTFETPMRQTVAAPPSPSPLSFLERPARRLERYRDCRTSSGATVFHSSYYRRPGDRSIPSVVTVYDFIYERYVTGLRRSVHLRQKHAAIRQAQAVICISHATRADLSQWIGDIPGQKVYVIHLAASPVFRPVDVELADKPYILFVGERGGYKNFRSVAGALSSLPDVELRCVGGGAIKPEELTDFDDDVRRRIRHLGFVTDEALNQQYNGALCLAYPSAYEGFGIPVVEAMQAACPVVCIADCASVIEIGKDALTVAPTSSPGDLAAAVARTREASWRARVIERGHVVASAMTWKDTHDQTLQVYRDLGARLDAVPPGQPAGHR